METRGLWKDEGGNTIIRWEQTFLQPPGVFARIIELGNVSGRCPTRSWGPEGACPRRRLRPSMACCPTRRDTPRSGITLMPASADSRCSSMAPPQFPTRLRAERNPLPVFYYRGDISYPCSTHGASRSWEPGTRANAGNLRRAASREPSSARASPSSSVSPPASTRPQRARRWMREAE